MVDLGQGVRHTYAQFDAEVDRLAAALIGAGLDVGDRVGIWAPNRVEWVVVQYATARAGVILVNLNPAYRAHELGFALRQSGCRLLITVPEFRGASYRELVDSVRADAADTRADRLPGHRGLAGAAEPGRRRTSRRWPNGKAA